MNLPPPADILVRITARHFCAGMIIRNGRVYTTAPILKALRGMEAEKALEHCQRQRYQVEIVP